MKTDAENIEEMFKRSVFLADVTITVFDAELKLHLYQNSKGKLYLIEEFLGELKIGCELNGNPENFDTDLHTLVSNWIKRTMFYNVYPDFVHSKFFTLESWNEIIQAIEDERKTIVKESQKRITPLIVFLKENDLNPQPSPFTVNDWTAS